jgi:hypothetical protein
MRHCGAADELDEARRRESRRVGTARGHGGGASATSALAMASTMTSTIFPTCLHRRPNRSNMALAGFLAISRQRRRLYIYLALSPTAELNRVTADMRSGRSSPLPELFTWWHLLRHHVLESGLWLLRACRAHRRRLPDALLSVVHAHCCCVLATAVH